MERILNRRERTFEMEWDLRALKIPMGIPDAIRVLSNCKNNPHYRMRLLTLTEEFEVIKMFEKDIPIKTMARFLIAGRTSPRPAQRWPIAIQLKTRGADPILFGKKERIAYARAYECADVFSFQRLRPRVVSFKMLIALRAGEVIEAMRRDKIRKEYGVGF